ncbi:MAG: branched-chain amino acid ABC transporter permease [Betaproteobacteria bacterium]
MSDLREAAALEGHASRSAGLRHAAILVAVLAALLVGALYLKRSDVYLLTLTMVYLMATLGLNLTVGYAGQMSLGQAAFFGIGAYIAAIALKAGVPFLAVVPIAAVACFFVGLALGFPALRVQHHYLAFATLGFNVLVFLVMRNEEKVTGGTYGITSIPRPTVFGWSFNGHYAFYAFTLASLVILGGLVWWLLRSPWGRAFAALRDNPIRAESLGVNITAYTLLAFAIGAACAGVGGVYYASLVEFIEPGPFHFSVSLMMLLAVIVGGSGRFYGPAVGTIVIILLPELLRSSNHEALKFMQKWYLVFFGLAVVALMVWLPGGLLSFRDRTLRKRSAK